MPPIQTIAIPHRNKISVAIPEEYSSYSFQVILVPLESLPSNGTAKRKIAPKSCKGNFVEALLSCPRLLEGEDLEITQNMEL